MKIPRISRFSFPKVQKRSKGQKSWESRTWSFPSWETVIEKELVDRLQQGVYGEIYNFNQRAFEGLIKEQGGQAQELEEESEKSIKDYWMKWTMMPLLKHFPMMKSLKKELEGEYEELSADENDLNSILRWRNDERFGRFNSN